MSETRATRQARLRRGFEQAAADYDRHAGVQQEVTRRLLARLELVRIDPTRILDLGAGTGEGAAQLQQCHPEAQVIAVDFAQGMLQRARARAPDGQPVVADAFQLPLAPASVDLVFSSSTLQWCVPLADALAEIIRVLRPGGLLMFSTYGPDTLRELATAQQAAGLDGGVNPFSDMHPIGDLLLEEGFRDPVLDVERLDVSYASARALVREIKGIGSRRLEPGAGPLPTRQQWRALDAAYPVDAQARVHATYEVIYAHAIAPLSRTRGTVSTVPVAGLARPA